MENLTLKMCWIVLPSNGIKRKNIYIPFILLKNKTNPIEKIQMKDVFHLANRQIFKRHCYLLSNYMFLTWINYCFIYLCRKRQKSSSAIVCANISIVLIYMNRLDRHHYHYAVAKHLKVQIMAAFDVYVFERTGW